MSEFQSTHKLDFEVAGWEFDPSFLRFRVGTCGGLYTVNKGEYVGLLAVSNKVPQNGHFEDVLEWFEYSCKNNNVSFKILEVWNERLHKHLIEKRGFVDIGNFNLEKKFN